MDIQILPPQLLHLAQPQSSLLEQVEYRTFEIRDANGTVLTTLWSGLQNTQVWTERTYGLLASKRPTIQIYCASGNLGGMNGPTERRIRIRPTAVLGLDVVVSAVRGDPLDSASGRS